MAVISMKQLLEAGVHFGHQTRRWNPKMAPYIFTERNGIYIIDLQKTVKKIEEAYDFVRSVAEAGKPILFVGTKKQAQQALSLIHIYFRRRIRLLYCAMAEMIQAAMCYCLCGELCPIMDDMARHLDDVLNCI